MRFGGGLEISVRKSGTLVGRGSPSASPTGFSPLGGVAEVLPEPPSLLLSKEEMVRADKRDTEGTAQEAST